MRPCSLCRSVRQRGLTGPFSSAGAPVWAFLVRGVFPLWKGLSIVFSGARSASMGLFPLGKGHAFCPGFPVCADFPTACLHSPFPRLFPMFFVCAGQGGLPSTVCAVRGDFSALRGTVCGCLREFFPLRGRMCGLFRAEGLFPHYPGAWFSLSRAFCRSRAGSKDASASGRAPYSGGTSVLYRSCGAQGVSGVFFRGYGLPQRLFPLTGTPCDAPGQRKSPPKGAFSWPCA